MRYWIGIGIVEHSEHGRGTSLRVEQDSFPSFNEAVERLTVMESPAVRGQVVEANAYVARAETLQDAEELLFAVAMRHETKPHVKLVSTSIRTRQVVGQPPDREALSRIHGELCITHQITDLALRHTQSGEYRDRLVRHKEAIEDLAYALRVMQAEMAGEEPPKLPPRGSERVGYGVPQLGDAESATLTSALSSLAAELSITQHQARVAQSALPRGDERLDELVAELSAFAGMVNEYS